MSKSVYIISLLFLVFTSCHEKPLNKKVIEIKEENFIPKDLDLIIYASLEKLETNSPQINFISYRLRKNDSIRSLKALGLDWGDIEYFYLSPKDQPFQLFALKHKVDIEKLYQNFLTKQVKFFSSEKLNFNSRLIYRLTRKDEDSYFYQISENKIIIGSKQDIIAAIQQNEPHPQVAKLNKNQILEFALFGNKQLPEQFKSLKSAKGVITHENTNNKIDITINFSNKEDLDKQKNLIQTLLGFAPLPKNLKQSITYSQADLSLYISGNIPDQELATYVKNERLK